MDWVEAKQPQCFGRRPLRGVGFENYVELTYPGEASQAHTLYADVLESLQDA